MCCIKQLCSEPQAVGKANSYLMKLSYITIVMFTIPRSQSYSSCNHFSEIYGKMFDWLSRQDG